MWARWVGVAAVLLATGCADEADSGRDCTSIGGVSVLGVQVPAALLSATETVQVGLCQQDRCADVTLPAAGATSPIRVDLDRFDTSYDADHPAEATVVLIGGPDVGGAALVRQQFDFDFDVGRPNGEGCDPEVLSHTVTVTAAQAPS